MASAPTMIVSGECTVQARGAEDLRNTQPAPAPDVRDFTNWRSLSAGSSGILSQPPPPMSETSQDGGGDLEGEVAE